MSVKYFTFDHRFDPPESAATYKTVEEALLQAASDTLMGSGRPVRIEDSAGKTIRNARHISQASDRLAAHREMINLARDANHPNPHAYPVATGELEAVNG